MKDCKVLIVDDNRDAADSTAQVLEAYGYEAVTVAYSPDEAVKAADETCPDVILMDISLPGQHGYDLAARIRKLHPKCKFVALTGLGRAEDYHRSQDAGFTHHLVKPVDPKRLERIVRHECEDAHHCKIN